MRVIICGAGQVGFGIARHLAAEGNDVTVVDRSSELIQRINNTLDVRALVGHGSHPQVLEDAGAEGADILIAVTASDEVNMVACQVALSLFSVPKRIARIRDQKYLEKEWKDLFSREDLPVDVIISPERAVADQVMRRLEIPGAYDTASFGNKNIQFLAINLDENCPVLETPLKQLTDLFPDLQATVIAVKRDGKLFVPKSDDLMMAGNSAFLVTASEDCDRTMTIFGHEEQEARNLIIVGGGNIGYHVARQLEKNGVRNSVRLIENSEIRARNIAETLSDSTVLLGSGLEPDILSEAGVRDAEILLALTNDDQVNLLTTMLARNEGCERALCLINNTSFLPLGQSIGLDISINPRAITVSSVLQHIRKGHVLAVHTIEDGEAEIIEAEVLETSAFVGQKLRQLNLPDTMRIGAIYRNDEVMMPRGNFEFKVGDRIVLFVLTDAVNEAENFFSVGLEYF